MALLMTFIWPAMLWLLVLVPLWVVLYMVLQRRRRRYAARYSQLGFGSGDRGRGPGMQRHIPPVVFLAGLTILLLSLIHI